MISQAQAVASVTCPMCKTVCQVIEGVECLTTNMYALNIIELKKPSRSGLYVYSLFVLIEAIILFFFI